ncbi:MBL fold metallo-hydrolase [Bacteroidota bacterium]
MNQLLKILLPVLLLCSTELNYAQQSVQISEDLTSTLLIEDVYLITHYFPRYGSNSLFVHLPGKNGVLIDTPHETSGTKSLLDWITDTFGNLDLIAINTGWHQDNLGGNEYLRSLNIDVYGPDLTCALLSERGDELKSLLLESTVDLEDGRFYKSYQGLQLISPNRVFPIKEGLLLELGGEKFQVYFPGESHTVDNTVVYLHEREVLFGGCMVLSMQHQGPGFTEHANMGEWPKSLEKIIKKFPSSKIVIPGHGSPGDVALLEHSITILNRYNAENPE